MKYGMLMALALVMGCVADGSDEQGELTSPELVKPAIVPSCIVVVSPLDQSTITVDVAAACSGSWTLNYRFFSSGLAMTNRIDVACGLSPHVEFLNSAAVSGLQAFAWINTSTQRVDCAVIMQ